jgi:hypothetical protein
MYHIYFGYNGYRSYIQKWLNKLRFILPIASQIEFYTQCCSLKFLWKCKYWTYILHINLLLSLLQLFTCFVYEHFLLNWSEINWIMYHPLSWNYYFQQDEHRTFLWYEIEFLKLSRSIDTFTQFRMKWIAFQMNWRYGQCSWWHPLDYCYNWFNSRMFYVLLQQFFLLIL